LVVVGAIEVARAIAAKDSLSRAAETISHELAYTDPNLNATFSLDPQFPAGASAWAATATADANRNANLSLPAVTISETTIITGSYSTANNDCADTTSPAPIPCQSISSLDGNLVITALPDMTAPTTVTVTIRQPFNSVMGRFGFVSRSDGKASETVSETTLYGHQLQLQ
jgi:Flp pilus assembly protein TadG